MRSSRASLAAMTAVAVTVATFIASGAGAANAVTGTVLGGDLPGSTNFANSFGFALGDSYLAGPGGQGANSATSCIRSTDNIPAQLALDAHVFDYSCSGGITGFSGDEVKGMLHGKTLPQEFDEAAQGGQGPPDWVLVSVGGNDRRFVPILLSCVMDDNGGQPVYETDLDVTRGKKQVIQGIPPVTPCNPGYLSNPKVWQQAGGPTSLAHPRGTPLPAIPASATAAIDAAFRDTLTRTYAALRAQYPCAQIFVNNYPELLPDRASDFGLANSDWPEFLHGITQDELDMLNVMWLRTNAVIDAAVKAAGPGFHLVDMNADRQFKAHNVASSDPWGKDGLAALQDLPVSWVTPGPWASAAPFHPNSMGQHQMAIRDVGDIAAVMALGLGHGTCTASSDPPPPPPDKCTTNAGTNGYLPNPAPSSDCSPTSPTPTPTCTTSDGRVLADPAGDGTACVQGCSVSVLRDDQGNPLGDPISSCPTPTPAPTPAPPPPPPTPPTQCPIINIYGPPVLMLPSDPCWPFGKSQCSPVNTSGGWTFVGLPTGNIDPCYAGPAPDPAGLCDPFDPYHPLPCSDYSGLGNPYQQGPGQGFYGYP
jgi:GDSL-like Lipase/Acylhydrolase family